MLTAIPGFRGPESMLCAKRGTLKVARYALLTIKMHGA
jgi:hypothetical protein